jgi:uncharacterized protein (UPF0305 family)
MKVGELDGLKIVVSPERFEEIKKQKIIQENKILKEQQEKIDKYEEVIDKIKEYIKENSKNISITPNSVKAVPVEYILELLEEIE